MIVSLSIPEQLLDRVDQSVSTRGFASRSEITRQALRHFMNEYKELDSVRGNIVATITITYRKGDGGADMLGVQHVYRDVLHTFLHAHVDEHNCLEVLVVKGQAERVRRFVQSLLKREEVARLKTAVIGAYSL
jgi:CopG family nickel-responsive transcriptional regulator